MPEHATTGSFAEIAAKLKADFEAMLLHGIEDPSFVRHDNTLARPYISRDHPSLFG